MDFLSIKEIQLRNLNILLNTNPMNFKIKTHHQTYAQGHTLFLKSISILNYLCNFNKKRILREANGTIFFTQIFQCL